MIAAKKNLKMLIRAHKGSVLTNLCENSQNIGKIILHLSA